MIVYFSGTGNSRAVAQRLARLLGDSCQDLTTTLSLRSEKRVVWVFPVHSWGIPPVVAKVLRRMVPGAVHHLVATCGDDAGLTDRRWRHILESRGCATGCAFTVIMPNTYVAMPGFDTDSPATEQSKLSAMEGRLLVIADAILAGRSVTDVCRGAFPAIKSHVIYPWFIRHAISPGRFAVDTTVCIGCGKCTAVCPVDNVTPDPQRRPSWGTDCTGCLACYHVCPRRAISYGSFTRGKGQYLCPLPSCE